MHSVTWRKGSRWMGREDWTCAYVWVVYDLVIKKEWGLRLCQGQAHHSQSSVFCNCRRKVLAPDLSLLQAPMFFIFFGRSNLAFHQSGYSDLYWVFWNPPGAGCSLLQDAVPDARCVRNIWTAGNVPDPWFEIRNKWFESSGLIWHWYILYICSASNIS